MGLAKAAEQEDLVHLNLTPTGVRFLCTNKGTDVVRKDSLKMKCKPNGRGLWDRCCQTL